MSQFSNISSDLQIKIASSLNELSNYSFADVASNFNNSNILNSSANRVITNALNDLQNNEYKSSYTKLKKTLKSAEEIYNKISNIKKLDNEIKDLQNQVPELESRKYKTETYTYTDYFGNVCTGTNTVIDQGVVNQINNIYSNIRDKENEIKTIEKQIYDAI